MVGQPQPHPVHCPPPNVCGPQDLLDVFRSQEAGFQSSYVVNLTFESSPSQHVQELKHFSIHPEEFPGPMCFTYQSDLVMGIYQ